jgi:hypothetical protein
LDAVRLRLRLTDRDESMKWGVLIGLRPYDISLKRDGQLLGRASYIPYFQRIQTSVQLTHAY